MIDKTSPRLLSRQARIHAYRGVELPTSVIIRFPAPLAPKRQPQDQRKLSRDEQHHHDGEQALQPHTTPAHAVSYGAQRQRADPQVLQSDVAAVRNGFRRTRTAAPSWRAMHRPSTAM